MSLPHLLVHDRRGDVGVVVVERIIRTANGGSTSAEAPGHREFVMAKLCRSA